MVASRSSTLWNDPRQIACLVMMPKKISTMFSHEQLVGGEVQGDRRIRGQPGPHVSVFVCCVVIAEDMQLHVGVCAGDQSEEVDKFLIRVPRVTLIGRKFPGRNVQCRGQSRCAMAFVVMRPGGRPTGV